MKAIVLPLLLAEVVALAAWGFQAPLVVEEAIPLNWDIPPHPNATGHLIFSTVSSLLQLWPNSIYRHGHNLVPAAIPAGTIFYHGRRSSAIPDAPDWLAFDVEHAFIFAGSNTGHVLTFATTRELKVLYFDGSSAAKMNDGSLDSQDVVMYQAVRSNNSWGGELERIRNLCAWGKPLGLDGFVRMEFHFELMYCDFTTDGLQLVSSLNVLPARPELPLLPKGEPTEQEYNGYAAFDGTGTPSDGEWPNAEQTARPPHRRPWPAPADPPEGWKGSLPGSIITEARITGKWHDHFPGETRLHLDYSGIVTFYDTALQSLVDSRFGQTRAQHRLLNISAADARAKVDELEEVLRRNHTEPRTAKGVDWQSITHVVIERYGDRLERLALTLASSRINVTTKAANARAQILTMLVPYITMSDAVPRSDGGKTWLAPVVNRCATTQTSSIPHELLTPQEQSIHSAVSSTLHEICRRLARMWDAAFDVEEAEPLRAEGVVEFTRKETSGLMEWLDWSIWVKCRPACAESEMCTVPIWPFRRDQDPDDMTPKCVPRPNVEY